MKIIGAIAVALSVTPALAQQSQTRSMPFEDCLATIRRTAGELGVAPINIVETDILRMVRFPTTDGSVLVTCSKPDQKMGYSDFDVEAAS